MILCATMCITDWAIVLFKGSFTWFGLFTNLLELFIACELGEYFMNFKSGEYPNYPDGKEDNTHLREKGARMVLELLINEMRKYPELNKLLK